MACWTLEYEEFFVFCLLHFRRFAPVQMFSHGEVGKLPYGLHSGHIRAISEPSYFMSQYSYNSLSRLGQPPAQQFNHGRSTSTFSRGSNWLSTLEPPISTFNSEGPRSPGSGSFINVISWGTFRDLEMWLLLTLGREPLREMRGPVAPFNSFLNSSFNYDAGHRANDAIGGIPPTSRGRRDYGRII